MRLDSEGNDRHAHSAADTAATNQAWAAAYVEACVTRGIGHFFLAPGSRCTPLTLAIANHPAAIVTQHFDERGLAFACLGFGRATDRPGVFVCTSGTAAANAFPAVIEASQEQIPMLLCTADRPPELRETGANQSIDQVHLFGRFAKWFYDMPCPTSELAPSFVHSIVSQAIQHSARGPVHLNCMFREPFGSPERLVAPSVASAAPELQASVPTKVHAPAIGDLTNSCAWPCHISEGPVLILLGCCRRAEALAVVELARRMKCPLLADVTSGIRTLAYDLGLWKALPAPRTVLHIGGRITSKRLWQFLEKHAPPNWIHLSSKSTQLDPVRRKTQTIVRDIVEGCASLPFADALTPVEFTQAWSLACAAAEQVIDDFIGQLAEISEPAAARIVAEEILSGHGLFLGNSMPIRDMDMFGAWSQDREVHVAANRGASGIDGTIATTAGFALGHGTPVTLMIGDLSALHDLNSLALLKRLSTPVIVVLINNDGGGIFHFLPVSTESPHFTQYFGTPHGLRFHQASAMFELPYESPQTLVEFRAIYRRALLEQRSVIIELRTNRERNLQLHRQIQATIQGVL